MEKSELLALAREYAANEDLYALLGIDALAAKESSSVQRAWRKASLQYHPDKAKDKFDPEKWQFLERARDVLMDAEAHAAYDSARSAALQRQLERQEMDAKRRAMIEDLEARERGGAAANKRMRNDKNHGMSEAERSRLAESGRRRMEERQRQKQEAEERMRKAAAEDKTHNERAQAGAPENSVPTGAEAPTSEPNGGEAKTEGGGGGGDDDEDRRIADLERRIEEARRRKDAKKARKSGVMPPASPSVGAMEEDGGDAGPARPQAQATPVKNNPGRAGVQADDQKGPPSAKSFSFSTPKSTPGNTPRSKGDFATVRERLAFAQRQKELKAKEAAAATTPTVTSPADSSVQPA